VNSRPILADKVAMTYLIIAIVVIIINTAGDAPYVTRLLE